MINNQFLLYQTVQAYQADVLNNNIKPTSIAFVVEDGTVRTHGFAFGGKHEDSDNKKHVFLTKAQYNALAEYERDTIYFIVESAIDEATDYQFGGRFPLIFGGQQTNNTEQSQESDNT